MTFMVELSTIIRTHALIVCTVSGIYVSPTIPTLRLMYVPLYYIYPMPDINQWLNIPELYIHLISIICLFYLIQFYVCFTSSRYFCFIFIHYLPQLSLFISLFYISFFYRSCIVLYIVTSMSSIVYLQLVQCFIHSSFMDLSPYYDCLAYVSSLSVMYFMIQLISITFPLLI